jgi:pimeloyl-ACP methyl ester carboxylesterase
VVIVAGDEDRLIGIDAQSARLHREVSQSSFHRIPGSGHMIHQTATGAVMAAINEVGEKGARIGGAPNAHRPALRELGTRQTGG